jgi:hypothetical protein
MAGRAINITNVSVQNPTYAAVFRNGVSAGGKNYKKKILNAIEI